jgi:hypothetical protein
VSAAAYTPAMGERIAALLSEWKLPTAAAELVHRLVAGGHDEAMLVVHEVLELEAAGSGSRGRLPAPGSHTTGRAVRHPAVQTMPASRRCGSTRGTSPSLRSSAVGMALPTHWDAALYQGPRPL